MSLPYICPDHPKAKIRHEWMRTRSEANWGPNRPRVLIGHRDHDHRYLCSKCGRELAAEEPSR